jgi:hypothetical protein
MSLSYAIIAAVNDDEQRFRYRVRIMGIHREDIPVDKLPWAEFCAPFSAKQACDLPHYEVGDSVYCMFLGGQTDQPVIMGGWITNSGDVPDVPVSMTSAYMRTRRRWNRADRQGNRLEQSEIGGENHIRMVSGNAEVRVTQNGNAVQLKSKSGPVQVIAKLLSVSVDTVSVAAASYELNANDSLLGVPMGTLALKANDSALVFGGILTAIGFYVPTLLGVPIGTARQSTAVQVSPAGSLKLGSHTGDVVKGVPLIPLVSASLDAVAVRVGGNVVDIGTKPGDLDGVLPLTPTAVLTIGGVIVNLYASSAINITSQVSVVVTAPLVSITAPNLVLTGDIALAGNLTVVGTITGTVVQDAVGTKLTSHVHPYVDTPAGAAVTAPPTPGT